MNLFDQITWKSSVQGFLWTKPTETPSFSQPIAPRTTSYTQPVKKMSYEMPWYYESTHSVDTAPTKSLMYKTIQWWADLFWGIQNRLLETAQADIQPQQDEINRKKVAFADSLIQKWYSKEEVFKSLDELKAKWAFDVKPNFATRTVQGLWNRMWEIGSTTENLSKIDNPIARTTAWILPYWWDVVATAFQPVVSALEPVVSPVIQKIVDVTW